MALDLLSSTDIEGSMLFTGIPNPKEGILYALEIVLQFVKKVVMRSLWKNHFHTKAFQLYHFLLH